MPFQELPTELQCSVIRLLDPIGLISLGQTSRHFRQLIDAKPKHFVERLLALETLVEHGGITPVFRSRDNDLKPHWTDERWEDMRWACTGCFRLLSHKHFNNISLLGLRYRKPIPGSPAANILSSWEPSGRVQDYRSRSQWLKDKQDEKRIRLRYSLCVTSGLGGDGAGLVSEKLALLKDCGMEGFETMSEDEFRHLGPDEKLRKLDINALLIELERCGTKRHLRRCNECRFQRGELGLRPDGSGGTSKVPLVKSRLLSFGTVLDRYFPDFSKGLKNKRPPFNTPLNLVHREDACDQAWTMYMVRCPQCAQWQELREFRFGGVHHHWTPRAFQEEIDINAMWDDRHVTEAVIDGLNCNRCYAKANGREELGLELLRWVKELIELQLFSVSAELMVGFRRTSGLLHNGPPSFTEELQELLSQTPFMDGGDSILSREEVAMMKLRYSQCKEIWERMKQSNVANWTGMNLDEWFDSCSFMFDMYECHWKWLMGCMEEVEEKPDALAEWALNRKGDSFL